MRDRPPSGPSLLSEELGLRIERLRSGPLGNMPVACDQSRADLVITSPLLGSHPHRFADEAAAVAHRDGT